MLLTDLTIYSALESFLKDFFNTTYLSIDLDLKVRYSPKNFTWPELFTRLWSVWFFLVFIWNVVKKSVNVVFNILCVSIENIFSCGRMKCHFVGSKKGCDLLEFSTVLIQFTGTSRSLNTIVNNQVNRLWKKKKSNVLKTNPCGTLILILHRSYFLS